MINQDVSPSNRWMVLPPLVLLPFVLGGARPWLWSFVAAIFFISMAAFIWVERRPLPLPARAIPWYRGGWYFLLGGIVVFPFVQLLPLPLSLLEVLSPSRLQWLQRAGAIDQLPGSTALSYASLTTLYSGLWWIFLAGYVLALKRFFTKERNFDRFFSILFFFTGFEAIYGLLQALIPTLGVMWQETASYGGFARGTFINRNHFACFLGMIWPLLLAYSLSLSSGSSASSAGVSFRARERNQENRQKQMFLGFIIGLILLSIVFSMSRGGIIATLVALTVFVMVNRTRQKGTLAFVAISWMVMIGYGAIIGFDAILLRFDMMENDAPGRFQIWKEAWQIIQDHPFTGTGLGTFATAASLYQTHLPDTIRASHAHNDYVQLLSELGIPTAGAMILLAWGYWWRVAFRLRRVSRKASAPEGGGSRQRQERLRLIAVGALAGSAAFLCHAWVDFNWQIPANQLYFLMLLVLMHVGSTESVKEWDADER